MNKTSFPVWLRKKYCKGGKYVDNRFGDLAKNLYAVIKSNPFEEDFDSYDTLEEWLEHLDMHLAPKSVEATMVDAWGAYISEGLSAEVDFIKGDKNEVPES